MNTLHPPGQIVDINGMQMYYVIVGQGEPHLSTIAARTLLVCGDRDELVPVQIALEIYTAIPHSYLWIVPNAGHAAIFSSLDEPWGLRPFIAAVLPFLRGDWERKEL
jgi:pimeloyl-ACP methyl ester carboxylesterase